MKRRGGSAPPCLARLALCAALATAQAQAQSQTLRERLGAACWQQQELGVGVSLRRAWFASLAVREQGPLPTGPQSLTILEVDLEAPDTRLTVAVPDLLRATSAQARDGGALAAVNGGFFTKDGKPVGMRLADGVAFGVASSPPRAAVGWNGRQVRFGRGSEDWSDWPQLVAAGPHLVAGGVVIDHGDKQRKVRHPRTALGVRGDGIVLLLTADGRTPLAAGLSLDELGDVMLGLGCVDAINLDGGGSSTLWALGWPGNGIANHPCDNKQFDPEGERAVADVVLVHARAVVVVDDDEAVVGDGRLWRERDGSGHLGDAFSWAPAGVAVTARFGVPVVRAGHYLVQRRSVVAPGLGAAAARWSDGTMLASDGDAAWITVGQRDLAAGTAEVVVTAVAGRPFVIDAVRLVEQ